MMRIYVIAGEASGDLHGADLIRELKKRIYGLQLRAWGGDLMQAEGAEVVKHYRELAFMGFTEVIMNLRTILNNIDACKKDIESYNPDAVILIDYPGFNLRIASFVKDLGIPVYYYISPQVWAWKSSRVEKIKKTVDRMFVILPFEPEFYKKFNYDVDFVGHPLPDVIKRKRGLFSDIESFRKKNNLSDKPIIALLPGSRRQEIKRMLPLMLSAEKKFPGYQFVIAGAPSLPGEYYLAFSESTPIINDSTYELLSHSYAALVTSGTATLETALLNVPEVVCYKGEKISYMIAKSLVKIKFISLVNLIMDREVVTELIQDNLNEKNIVEELKKILDPSIRERIYTDYAELQEKLSAGGAAARTAELISADLEKGKSVSV
jgi:lipid-A-disaccharide synthase